MLGFKKRSVKIDPVEQLITEFWRVNREVEELRAAYADTKDLYIDCTVYDLNAKIAYRDVLLKELRSMKDVDWAKYNAWWDVEVWKGHDQIA